MKKTTVSRGGLISVLAAMILWPSILPAQTATEIKEYQEQLRKARLELEQARLAELQEARTLAGEELTRIQEHRLQELREREARAVLEARLRSDETAWRAQARQEKARARVLAQTIRERQAGEEARAQRGVERAQQVMVQLRSRARIGVSLDARQGREFDGQGALVKGVMDDSPAEEAGLRGGDVITHLDGHSLLAPLAEGMEEELDEYESLPVQRLMALARELEGGEEVEVRYQREGEERSVSLQAAELDDIWTRLEPGALPRGMVFHFDPEEGRRWTFRMPDRGVWVPELEELEKLKGLEELEELDIQVPEIRLRGIRPGWTPEDREVRILRRGDHVALGLGGLFSMGLSLRTLSPELGEYFSSDRGVLVLEVHEDSELGLQPGDVILSIDGREVEDEGDVIRILRSYEEGEPVDFLVKRHGEETRVQGRAQ